MKVNELEDRYEILISKAMEALNGGDKATAETLLKFAGEVREEIRAKRSDAELYRHNLALEEAEQRKIDVMAANAAMEQKSKKDGAWIAVLGGIFGSLIGAGVNLGIAKMNNKTDFRKFESAQAQQRQNLLTTLEWEDNNTATGSKRGIINDSLKGGKY